ncbi:MAG: radical SAM protein [Pseudomonadota bacterium]
MAALREPTPQQFPVVTLAHLDQLWFQIVGTRCNLRCSHCFISCSPENLSFGSLTRETVAEHLTASVRHGVKEYYFTGGEPFLHPQIVEILSLALEYGPVTVLTNGTVMTPRLVDALAEAAAGSLYSLEFRVSIDHFDETENDRIRGAGAYRKALRGMHRLSAGGFVPIVTAMRTWELDEDLDVIANLSAVLRDVGIDKPRIKILPSLKIGAEAERSGGYEGYDYVTEEMLREFPMEQFVCSHSRIVTDRGVHVCPILIEAPDSILGQNLDEATAGFALSHQACSTCYQYGAFCANPSALVAETGASPAPQRLSEAGRKLDLSAVAVAAPAR